MAKGALAAPTIAFKIQDADPHSYCAIIRFRETIGSGTWNWDSGWSSMRAVFAENMNPTIALTAPDYQGNCVIGVSTSLTLITNRAAGRVPGGRSAASTASLRG